MRFTQAYSAAPVYYAIAARHTPPAADGGAPRNWGAIGLAGLAVIAAVAVYLMARQGFFVLAK